MNPLLSPWFWVAVAILAGSLLAYGYAGHRRPAEDPQQEAELDAEWLAILRAIKSDTPEFDRLAAERTLREIRGL